MHKVQLHNTTHVRMREARNKVLELLAADAATKNMYAVLKIAEIQKKIEESDLDI